MRFELSGLSADEVNTLVPDRPVLITWAGSISHGTHIDQDQPEGIDDRDLTVVYIPSLYDYFPLKEQRIRGQHRKIREWDVVAFEASHFIRLLTGANPNVLSALWMPDFSYLVLEKEGILLREHRQLFLSKKVFHSFGGYAKDQLIAAARDPMKIDLQNAFMGEKRRGLIKKYGYDVKAASHAIRLMQMGIEILETGKVFPDRRDKKDQSIYINIKQGKWPLSAILKHMETLTTLLETALRSTALPDEPDYDEIAELMIDLLSYGIGPEVGIRRRDVVVAFDRVKKENKWAPATGTPPPSKQETE